MLWKAEAKAKQKKQHQGSRLKRHPQASDTPPTPSLTTDRVVMMQAVEYTRVTIGIWRYSCRIVWYAIVHPKTSRNTNTKTGYFWRVATRNDNSTTVLESVSPVRDRLFHHGKERGRRGGGRSPLLPTLFLASWLTKHTTLPQRARARPERVCCGGHHGKRLLKSRWLSAWTPLAGRWRYMGRGNCVRNQNKLPWYMILFGLAA